MAHVPDDLPHLDRGLSAFADSFDVVLCDVWGVIHNGVVSNPDAVSALRRFRAGGGTVILVTNAPVPQALVQRRMDGLHVPRDAYDGISTSGDVTVAMIVEAGCPPIFHIGPSDELIVYEEAALRGGRPPALTSVDRAELAVCIGLDEIRSRPEHYDTILAGIHTRDLTLICANPDIVVEVGDDVVFCAGAIAERYAAIGGTVIQAGKPFPKIYARAMDMAQTCRSRPTPASRVLAIGDAMHTDVLGAQNQGFASLLVTSGIHRPELHPDGNPAIDAAALFRLLDKHKARPTAALPRLRW